MLLLLRLGNVLEVLRSKLRLLRKLPPCDKYHADQVVPPLPAHAINDLAPLLLNVQPELNPRLEVLLLEVVLVVCECEVELFKQLLELFDDLC